MGPFLSGSLFSLASRIQPKGEAIPFGVFAAVSLVGFFLSFGIKARELEAEGWESSGDDDDEEEDDENENGSVKSDEER